MRRLGSQTVSKLMPEMHRAVVVYIEREKRKAGNKKQRERLMQMMGQGEKKVKSGEMKEEGMESSDEDSSDEENTILKVSKEEKESDDE
jgi:hypothetical protein